MNFKNLSATDRLLLARVRIWGPTIPTHLPSGIKQFKKRHPYERKEHLHAHPVHNPVQNYPYVRLADEYAKKQEVLDEKKLRFMMKGVKIGRKKGGGKLTLMSVFEKKR